MALVRWQPLSPTRDFFGRDLDDMFRNLANVTTEEGLNVYETKDSFVVEALVPGIPSDNVNISVEGGMLTVEGRAEEKAEDDKNKRYVRREISKSYFYQTSLPGRGDWDKVNAEVEDGVVKVTIPKAEDEKPRQIRVKKK